MFANRVSSIDVRDELVLSALGDDVRLLLLNLEKGIMVAVWGIAAVYVVAPA